METKKTTKILKIPSFTITLSWHSRLKFPTLIKSIQRQMPLALEVLSVFIKEHPRTKKKMKNDKDKEIELNLSLCGDAKIRNINALHRQKDKVTDVLSFPSDSPRSLPFIFLGDILIDLNQAKRQAKEFKIPLEEEFWHLFVHGALHLLDFDHEVSKAEEKLMFSLEEKLVTKIIYGRCIKTKTRRKKVLN